MKKIVAITGVGTYPVPWLEYGIASIYNHVDEIVVVNSGYNFPLFTEYDVPLPEVSSMLREIDENGKIHEIQQVTWEKVAKYGNEIDRNREGIRALGMTYANDIAGYELGADWILKFDSDQVFFPNVKNIRELVKDDTPDGYQFLEYKSYHISPQTMAVGREAQDVSHNDGTKLYKFPGQNGKRQYFYGEGAITHYREQAPSDAVTTAHLRECYPLRNGTHDYQGLFLNYFQRMLFHSYDQGRLYRKTKKEYDKTFDEMIVYAFESAKHRIFGNYEIVPANPKPPEVIEIGAKRYIEREESYV